MIGGPIFKRLTADVVLRAYYAARLGDPEKAPVTFGSEIVRAGAGHRVVVDLSCGKSFGEVLNAKAVIASGLGVAESQVRLEGGGPTCGHVLWIADRPRLQGEAL